MADTNLKVKISAVDKTQKAFRSVAFGLKAVQRSLFSFRAGIVAAIGATGLGLLIKSSLDSIDKISKMSRTLGIAVPDLRKLEHAAELSGVQLDTLARGVRTLNKGALDFVKRGSGEAKDAFEALGISADDLNGVLGDQFAVLELIADRFDGVTNSAERSSIAQELFGGRASDLLIVLEEGGEGLRKMGEEAETLGLVLSAKSARGVEDANDAFTRLFSVFKGIRDTIISALAPAFQHLADSARDALLNKIGKDFKSTENLGKEMAIAIIDAFKAIVKGFNNFYNELVQGVNTLRRTVFDLKQSLSFETEQKDFDEQFEKIKKNLEEFTEVASKAGPQFVTSMQGAAKILKPLIDGADLTSDEIKEMANSLRAASQLSGAATFPLQNLADLTDELARRTKNMGTEFVEFQKLNITLGSMFDDLIASLNNTSEGTDNVDNSVKKAGLSVATLTDILLTIPPTLDDVNKTFDKTLMSMKDIQVNGVNSLEDALLSLANRTSTVKDAFKSMARSIINDLMRMAIQQQITGPLAQMMGLQVSTPTGTPTGKAIGGPVQAGRPYMVGERGPEMFVPNQSGSIVPNGQMASGGVNIVQNINITTGVQQTVRAEVMQMLPQISNAAKGAVLDARRRGGSFAAAF
jgi:methyl-accepting chemotaxis protein